jgi:hypothetical protein
MKSYPSFVDFFAVLDLAIASLCLMKECFRSSLVISNQMRIVFSPSYLQSESVQYFNTLHLCINVFKPLKTIASALYC